MERKKSGDTSSEEENEDYGQYEDTFAPSQPQPSMSHTVAPVEPQPMYQTQDLSMQEHDQGTVALDDTYADESYDYGQYEEGAYDDGSGMIDPNTDMPLAGVKQDLVTRLVQAEAAGSSGKELKVLLKARGVKKDLVTRLVQAETSGSTGMKASSKTVSGKSIASSEVVYGNSKESKAAVPGKTKPSLEVMSGKSKASTGMGSGNPGLGHLTSSTWQDQGVSAGKRKLSPENICKNCRSAPCKNREPVPNTGVLMVGMAVGMCGGGGKVLEISNHSVLINRKQHFPGGKVVTKRYIVEDVGVDDDYSPITFDCGPVANKEANK